MRNCAMYEGKQPFFCNVVVRWVTVHNARPIFVVTDQIVHNRLHKYNPERAGFCTHFRTSTFECLHKTVHCIEMTYSLCFRNVVFYRRVEAP